MAQRSSVQDSDGVIWQTLGIQIGTTGLDLRSPVDQTVLTELMNARFQDSRTVLQRDGHAEMPISDGGNAIAGPITDIWTLGHGLTTMSSGGHVPRAGAGRGIIELGDSRAVWTGDRLLVAPTERDHPWMGSSAFWQRGESDTELPWGIPAYLPQQEDVPLAIAYHTNQVAQCLTPTARAVISNAVRTPGNTVALDMFDRETGVLLNHTEFSAPASANSFRILYYSGYLVALFAGLNAGDGVYWTHWSGSSWTTPALLVDDDTVIAYEVALTANLGGFIIVWMTGTVSGGKDYTIGAAYYGQVVGLSVTSSTPTTAGWANQIPQVPASAVAQSFTPTGNCAVACAADGTFALAFQCASNVVLGAYNADGSVYSSDSWYSAANPNGDTPYSFGGITLTARSMPNVQNALEFVCHFGAINGSEIGSVNVVRLNPEQTPRNTHAPTTIDTVYSIYNASLLTRSFTVGDEVFAWCIASNSRTAFLIAGEYACRVCGVADRETTQSPGQYGNGCVLQWVSRDPNSETGTAWSWARGYLGDNRYAHPGAVLSGDMEFLPELTWAQYGSSAYLSGSLVTAWDGIELAEAGWQDFPLVKSVEATTGGSLTQDPTLGYQFFARVVRYSYSGERFESATEVSNTVTKLSGGNNAINVTVSTVPITNAERSYIEIYRTVVGGTAYYLDGVVDNDPTAPTVTWKSIQADSTLEQSVADSHEVGTGITGELESWGPTGCAVIDRIGDRLWCLGGQIPAGIAVFSKLWTQGFGAGFDDLAGFVNVDIAGAPLTSVAGINDAKLIFGVDEVYALGGTGPDNFGTGTWGVPQIVLAAGATTHAGTALTQQGIVYWGAAGPRLITTTFQAMDISEPVHAMTAGLTPTGVRVDLGRMEVVWYTADGSAVLWNYLDGGSRWARWSGLEVASAAPESLVTPDGRLLIPGADTGDGGRPVRFTARTALLRPESTIAGGTRIRSVGVAGSYLGPHELRTRVYYDGSPLWSEEWTWKPDAGTFLQSGAVLGDLTPAQIDASGPIDQTGRYMVHRRTKRNQCASFQVEISDIGASGPSLIPTELTVEIGSDPNLARISPPGMQ